MKLISKVNSSKTAVILPVWLEVSCSVLYVNPEKRNSDKETFCEAHHVYEYQGFLFCGKICALYFGDVDDFRSSNEHDEIIYYGSP